MRERVGVSSFFPSTDRLWPTSLLLSHRHRVRPAALLRLFLEILLPLPLVGVVVENMKGGALPEVFLFFFRRPGQKFHCRRDRRSASSLQPQAVVRATQLACAERRLYVKDALQTLPAVPEGVRAPLVFAQFLTTDGGPGLYSDRVGTIPSLKRHSLSCPRRWPLSRKGVCPVRVHLPVLALTVSALLAACGASTPQAASSTEASPAASAAAFSALAVSWPVLRSGAAGSSVESLQYLLRAQGQNISVDGQFGSGTEAAVRNVQQAKGLSADGVVGEQTWQAIIVTVQEGSVGDAVRAVQKRLGISVDGQFGSGTRSAVVNFQSGRGLSADGVVGPNTWRELVGSSGGTTPPSTTRAGLAAQIQGNSRVRLATVLPSGVRDSADPASNIRDTANGGAARRSSYEGAPGGTVLLDTRMLQGMLNVAGPYTYSVSAIAGGSHSSNSRHYAGLAFDVNVINGVGVSSSNAAFRNFMQACRNAGATEVLGPGDAGHSGHVHCAWPR